MREAGIFLAFHVMSLPCRVVVGVPDEIIGVCVRCVCGVKQSARARAHATRPRQAGDPSAVQVRARCGVARGCCGARCVAVPNHSGSSGRKAWLGEAPPATPKRRAAPRYREPTRQGGYPRTSVMR